MESLSVAAFTYFTQDATPTIEISDSNSQWPFAILYLEFSGKQCKKPLK